MKSVIKQLVAAALAVALAASATPALAAESTETLTGSLDFAGVTAASHVNITAYAAPATIVPREGMRVLGETSVDFVPGAAAQQFSLTVPSGSSVLLNFDSTTVDGLVDQWWLGSGGQIAGAWPVVNPITATTTVGSVPVVRAGAITAALEYAARQVCILRLDRTVVTCLKKPVNSTQFAFEGLYHGEYVVSAKGATVEFTVRVEQGRTNEVDFTEGGVIVGYAKNSAGKALKSLPVWTIGANGERVSTRTDSKGRYELDSVESGSANVFASDGPSGYVNLSGAYGPLLVEHVRTGQVTKAPTIVLRKAGRVNFTPMASASDVITVMLMKGDRVYKRLDLDYRDGISRGSRTMSVNPGTYKLVTIDRNGQRKASSKKIVIREGKTLKLGTVARTKSTYTVSGTVAGAAQAVRLFAGPSLRDAVMATSPVTGDSFSVKSVAKGVYYARSVSPSGVLDEHGLRVRVTGSTKIVVRAVNEGTIGALVSYNGRPFNGGAVELNDLTAPIDATGHFTAPAANRDFLGANAITSPALGALTPYVFGVPSTTFDSAPPVVLDSTSIYGG